MTCASVLLAPSGARGWTEKVASNCEARWIRVRGEDHLHVLLERERFRNQADSKIAVFDFIEGWYNPHRRHSALDHQSPLNYERKRLPAA